MSKRLTMALTAILAVISLTVGAITPIVAHAQQNIDEAALQQAAANIEGAIQGAMSRAGQAGQPTLGQLGGVQGGSTGSDASGGAGGSGSSGGSGGSGGGSGGPSGGQSQ